MLGSQTFPKTHRHFFNYCLNIYSATKKKKHDPHGLQAEPRSIQNSEGRGRGHLWRGAEMFEKRHQRNYGGKAAQKHCQCEKRGEALFN